MGYDRAYYLKKAFDLFPGVVTPVAGDALQPFYDRRSAGRGSARIVVDAIVGAAFLAWLPFRARQVQRRFGKDRPWRRRALAIARATFADPNDVALFRIENVDAMRRHIRRYEDAALNKRINPLGWTPACVLADKARFGAHCRKVGLPHAETIAEVSADGVTMLADGTGRALVVKPAHGEGGSGVHVMDAVADHEALAARLRDLARAMGGSDPLVVQPLICPHPALADLALAALPTVRIVTMLDEGGVPEVVSATFRCPSDPAARVDNMKAGGLIAPVDLRDGRLGVACKGYAGGDYATHPVTGAQIEGRALPDWSGAVALAKRAHAAFPDYALIGWDVALTPDAPLLIEGNGKPGVLMPQRAARQGLAQGRYGTLLAHHLAMKA